MSAAVRGFRASRGLAAAVCAISYAAQYYDGTCCRETHAQYAADNVQLCRDMPAKYELRTAMPNMAYSDPSVTLAAAALVPECSPSHRICPLTCAHTLTHRHGHAHMTLYYSCHETAVGPPRCACALRPSDHEGRHALSGAVPLRRTSGSGTLECSNGRLVHLKRVLACQSSIVCACTHTHLHAVPWNALRVAATLLSVSSRCPYS